MESKLKKLAKSYHGKFLLEYYETIKDKADDKTQIIIMNSNNDDASLNLNLNLKIPIYVKNQIHWLTKGHDRPQSSHATRRRPESIVAATKPKN